MTVVEEARAQVATTVPTARRARRSRRHSSDGLRRLRPASAIGLGVTVLWFSVLALIPLAAVVAETASGGWTEFWNTITNPQTAAAIRLTVVQAFLVTLVNIVMGTLIA